MLFGRVFLQLIVFLRNGASIFYFFYQKSFLVQFTSVHVRQSVMSVTSSIVCPGYSEIFGLICPYTHSTNSEILVKIGPLASELPGLESRPFLYANAAINYVVPSTLTSVPVLPGKTGRPTWAMPAKHIHIQYLGIGIYITCTIV